MNHPISRPLALFPLLAVLGACGGGAGGSTGGAGAGPTVVQDTVELDGVLLVVGDGPALALLDPSTGQMSKDAWSLLGTIHLDDAVAVSPDGRRVAWIGSDTSVHAADVIVEGGLPTLHEAQALDAKALEGIGWSPDGDRIFTRDLWIDPSTGASHDCFTQPHSASATASAATVVPLPGGHRYVCVETQRLCDDGRFVAPVATTGPATSDGQFYGLGLHTPTATARSPVAASDPSASSSTRVPFPLPDGRVAALPDGTDGKSVTITSATNGFATIYTVNDIPNPPGPVGVNDPAAAFASGSWSSSPPAWDVPKALDPWLHDGDGRHYVPLGLTGDGTKLVYAVKSWIIAQSLGDPVQEDIGVAIVEVDRDGTSRGFHVVDRGLWLNDGVEGAEGERHFQPDLLGPSGLVDLGGGDWLYGFGGSVLLTDATTGNWLGYMDGKPVELASAGRMSGDGRTFFSLSALPSGPSVCIRAVRGDTTRRCLRGSKTLIPYAIVGQGLSAAHQTGAPVLAAASRWAAWSGSTVTLHGARFGASGSITVGGVAVPAADVTAWGDTRITFRMSDALPAAGVVCVTTPSGASDRELWLYRTALATTPFDRAASALVSLGQGFNAVDLGDVGALPAVHGPPVTLSPNARLADGRYVVYSTGAATPTEVDLPVPSGAFTHTLTFQLEDRLADPTRWQVVSDAGFASDAQLTTIAGDLVERSSASHPLVGNRLSFASATALPDTWQNVAGGALALFASSTFNAPWAFKLLTSFTGTDGAWGTPVYAASPSATLPYFFRGLAADGDTLLFTGGDPAGTDAPAILTSTDGGKTLSAPTLLKAQLGAGVLREPIFVDAEAGKLFLAFTGSYYAPDVTGVHAITPSGAVTPNVTTIPADAFLPGGTVLGHGPTHVTSGGKVLILFGKTLSFVDFDATASGPRTWTTAPSASDAGHVQSLTRDASTGDVLAVRDDGTVARATEAGGWKDWAPLDLGISLALPTRVVPLTLGKLPDGRWLVAAKLFDGAPGAAATAEHPLTRSGFLVSPTP